MYVIYPYYYNKYISPVDPNPSVNAQHEDQINYDKYLLRRVSENLSISFTQFRTFFGDNLKMVIFPGVLACAAAFYVMLNSIPTTRLENMSTLSPFSFEVGSFFTPILLAIFTSLSICYMELFIKNNLKSVKGFLPFAKKHFLYVFVINLIIALAVMQFGFKILIGLFFIPPQLIIALFDLRFGDSNHDTNSFGHNINIGYTNYFTFLLPAIITISFIYVLNKFVDSWIIHIMSELVQWHGLFDPAYITSDFIIAILKVMILLFLLPLTYFLYHSFYYSAKCKKESIDLKARIASFGKGQNIFE